MPHIDLRPTGRTNHRPSLLAAALAAVVVGSPVLARAPGLEGFPDAALGRVLAPYVDGDVDDPAALRELWRTHGDTIPPAVFLALADALLRAGKVRMATQSLTWAAERAEDVATHGWAELGLGWIELAAGDLAAARSHFERIAMDGEWNALLASTLVGLTAAAQGDGPRAAALLGEVAGSPAAPYSLRVSSRLGMGYAFLWGGQHATAATTFAQAAAEYPGTPLTDDARYGAAVSRIRAGDRTGGIEALRDLAGAEPIAPGSSPTSRLVNLRPAAVLGRSLRRYRGAGANPPDEELVRILDLDGATLAGVALARLESPASARADELDVTSPDQTTGSQDPDPPTRDDQAPRPFGWAVGTALIVAIITMIAIFAMLRSRRHARAGARSSTPPRR